MGNINYIYLGIVILIIIMLSITTVRVIENFSLNKQECIRGYCSKDIEDMKNYEKYMYDNYKVCCNDYKIGYDNPYIYPYNYNIKNIDFVSNFKFPQWYQYLMMHKNKHFGFTGNI